MPSVARPAIVAKRFGYALKRAGRALRVSMDDTLPPLELTMVAARSPRRSAKALTRPYSARDQ